MLWFVRMPSTNAVTNKRISPAVARGSDYSFGYSLMGAPSVAMTMAVTGDPRDFTVVPKLVILTKSILV